MAGRQCRHTHPLAERQPCHNGKSERSPKHAQHHQVKQKQSPQSVGSQLLHGVLSQRSVGASRRQQYRGWRGGLWLRTQAGSRTVDLPQG